MQRLAQLVEQGDELKLPVGLALAAGASVRHTGWSAG